MTAYRWFREGKLPVPAHRAGRLILVDQPPVNAVPGITAVDARVSSADQRSDLDRQVARVSAWAAAQSLATTIGVEHRDRFARFGAEYVEAALAAQSRRLLVVDPSEVDDDLVWGVTEIPTSLCARLSGRRAAANRAAKAIAAATREDP